MSAGTGAGLGGTEDFPGPLGNLEAEERGVTSPGSQEGQGSAPRALGTPGLHEVQPGRLQGWDEPGSDLRVGEGTSGFSPESGPRGFGLPALRRKGRSWSGSVRNPLSGDLGESQALGVTAPGPQGPAEGAGV